MTGLLFAVVVVIAAGVWIRRGMAARAAARHLREGPGSSPEQAIPVRSFDDIDLVVAGKQCTCGTTFRLIGEGSRQDGDQPLRTARLACDECEEIITLYFDLTELRH